MGVLFGMDKVELKFTRDAMLEIGKMAISKKTGARGLRSILEKLLLDVMFEIPGSNVESVEVTRDAVLGMSGPTFYYAQDKDTVRRNKTRTCSGRRREGRSGGLT